MTALETIPVLTEVVVKDISELREANYVVEKDRKLARIVEIDDVVEHKNADKLELGIVGGWQCVIKKDEFKKGDRAIYCEIDSLLPIANFELFGFLEARNSDNRNIEGKRYHRLKTAKFRKELAQGLLVPIPAKYQHLPVDTNLTLELGILKYEPLPPMHMQRKAAAHASWYVKLATRLMGDIGGGLLPWPKQLTKSDQDRVQNKSTAFRIAVEGDVSFEVTYKLDGSSMTCFLINDEGKDRSGVCSRNYELSIGGTEYTFMQQLRVWVASMMFRNRRLIHTRKFQWVEWKKGSDGTSDHFTEMYAQLDIAKKLKDYYKLTGDRITIQGELIGPNIQSNFEGVTENQYWVFSVYKNGSEEVLPDEAREIIFKLGLKYVPVLDENYVIPKDATIADIVAMGEGKPAFNKTKDSYREGLVFKARNQIMSWKAISNKYLLAKDKKD